jgi:hypothetical protein
MDVKRSLIRGGTKNRLGLCWRPAAGVVKVLIPHPDDSVTTLDTPGHTISPVASENTQVGTKIKDLTDCLFALGF